MGVCATRMGVHVQSLVTDRRNAKTRTWVAASSAISVAPMHDRPAHKEASGSLQPSAISTKISTNSAVRFDSAAG